MPKQRFGLGRGLDALIPGASLADVAPLSEDTPLDSRLSPSSVFEAPVDAISPNPQQPRASVEDDPQLRELAASIREYGLLQPLLVTISGEDDHGPLFQLIAGERRWRASRLAELRMVPVVIREATPQLMLEMALIENLQRTDLNPLEEAQGYLMLMEEYGLTQELVAQRIGRNRATIANTVRLLQLPEEVREALVTMPRAFTEGHARAVLQINGDAARINAMKQIIAQGMSVRQAEELARRMNERALGLANDRRGSDHAHPEHRDADAGGGVHPRRRDEGAAAADDTWQGSDHALLHQRPAARNAVFAAGGRQPRRAKRPRCPHYARWQRLFWRLLRRPCRRRSDRRR